MTIVEVEFMTLVTIIGAAVLGAYLGAGVVCGFARRKVQIGMGIGAAGAAALMVLSLPGIGPRARHRARADRAPSWRIAVGISIVLGALMMLGIGFYASLPDHDQPARHGSDGCPIRS